MTVKLPPDLETHIAEKASAEGITVDAYVERIMRDATGASRREGKPLPVWPGRALSHLHREDLYDDVG
jgi:hypothetical protein